MGQLDLWNHVAPLRRRRRSGGAGVVPEDHEWKFRQPKRRALLATGIACHGVIPRYFAKRRKHLRHRGPGRAPMARLRRKNLAFRWSVIATSARPTRVPAWS